ncbi:uncharacterized protein AMSG_11242 [Thecamonas trahens ATCC 50062]|uniref:Uncharacterized protein n=1 Tax=Thecamonas trahens ATCC 50062 TaxID=461836 RepID=A0A0L0DUC9_THETB|nr:hypothetical protein AMSG_11242 [Thecamonas trahens ATCC 50062]KNC55807.1 hypothetical protein AMSG_11242 [Thecamonas trahens ATCC 50062]|eukprot:XP_013752831.1 hypothetical protein AMSG_11242 [Thecamonas trahens ATCC 50062]
MEHFASSISSSLSAVAVDSNHRMRPHASGAAELYASALEASYQRKPSEQLSSIFVFSDEDDEDDKDSVVVVRHRDGCHSHLDGDDLLDGKLEAAAAAAAATGSNSGRIQQRGYDDQDDGDELGKAVGEDAGYGFLHLSHDRRSAGGLLHPTSSSTIRRAARLSNSSDSMGTGDAPLLRRTLRLTNDSGSVAPSLSSPRMIKRPSLQRLPPRSPTQRTPTVSFRRKTATASDEAIAGTSRGSRRARSSTNIASVTVASTPTVVTSTMSATATATTSATDDQPEDGRGDEDEDEDEDEQRHVIKRLAITDADENADTHTPSKTEAEAAATDAAAAAAAGVPSIFTSTTVLAAVTDARAQHSPKAHCALRVTALVHQRLARSKAAGGTMTFVRMLAIMGTEAELELVTAIHAAIAAFDLEPFAVPLLRTVTTSELVDAAVAAGVLIVRRNSPRGPLLLAFVHPIEWISVRATIDTAHAEFVAYHLGRVMAASPNPRHAAPSAYLGYARLAWDIELVLDALATLTTEPTTRSVAHAAERLRLLARVRGLGATPILTHALVTSITESESPGRYNGGTPTFAEAFISPTPRYRASDTVAASALAAYIDAIVDDVRIGRATAALLAEAVEALELLATLPVPPALLTTYRAKVALANHNLHDAHHHLAAVAVMASSDRVDAEFHAAASRLLLALGNPGRAVAWAIASPTRPSTELQCLAAEAALANGDAMSASGLVSSMAPDAWLDLVPRLLLIDGDVAAAGGRRSKARERYKAVELMDVTPASSEAARVRLALLSLIVNDRETYWDARAALMGHLGRPAALAWAALVELVAELADLPRHRSPAEVISSAQPPIAAVIAGFGSPAATAAAAISLRRLVEGMVDVVPSAAGRAIRRGAVLMAAELVELVGRQHLLPGIDVNLYATPGQIPAAAPLDAPVSLEPETLWWGLDDALHVVARMHSNRVRRWPSRRALITWLEASMLEEEIPIAIDYMLAAGILRRSQSAAVASACPCVSSRAEFAWLLTI